MGLWLDRGEVWKFPSQCNPTKTELENLLKRVGNYDINYIKRYKLSPKAESHKKEICTKVLPQLHTLPPRKQQTKQNSQTLTYVQRIFSTTFLFMNLDFGISACLHWEKTRKQTNKKHEMSIKHDVFYCCLFMGRLVSGIVKQRKCLFIKNRDTQSGRGRSGITISFLPKYIFCNNELDFGDFREVL